MFGALLNKLSGQGGGSVSFDDVKAASETGSAHLVDVREPAEFAAGHIPGSINLPLSRFDTADLPTGKPVILICLSGARSGRAKSVCGARAEVAHFSPGVSGWANAGGKLER